MDKYAKNGIMNIAILISIQEDSLMWQKYRTSILIALTFSLLLSMFWLMPSLAFIIFLSLLLQLLLSPVVERLARWLPRGLSAGLVLAASILIVVSFLTLVSSTFVPTLRAFVIDLPNLSTKIQDLIHLQNSAFLNNELDTIWKDVTNFSVETLKSSLTILISAFNKFIDLIIILFVTFYLLKDGETIKRYIAHLFPHGDYARVLSLFDRILKALHAYICSQLVICLITGTIVFLYFTLRGIPYASVFAVVSGICEFIPVLGPTVASAFGTVLTATQTPWLALQTMLFYVILTQINHNIVYPTLIGKSLNLHPISIVLGIILGGEVLSTAGMFLAVPCIVIIKIVIEDIYENRPHVPDSLPVIESAAIDTQPKKLD